MSLDLYNQACKLSDQDAVDFTRKTILFDNEFECKFAKNFSRKRKTKYINSGIELILIDIDKLPMDISERYKALAEYIIPD